jgi:hypothetical protein
MTAARTHSASSMPWQRSSLDPGTFGSGRAPMGLGTTRDVVIVDALLVSQVASAASESPDAARDAAQADWDQRDPSGELHVLGPPTRSGPGLAPGQRDPPSW